jgi:hypothetical protein
MTPEGIEPATFRLVTQVLQPTAPSRAFPGERISILHWTEDRVDCRTIREVLKKRKICGSAGNQTPDCQNFGLLTTDKIIKLFLYVIELRVGKLMECSCRNDKETASCVTEGLLVFAPFSYSDTHYQRDMDTVIKLWHTLFFNCCLSVHVDNYTIIIPTKCTRFLLLKSQDITICNFACIFVPTCFNPRGSSSGGSMPVPG